ncbi:hypothetical protein B296_00029977 [Ensete ventricosum]|uniref:Uncharacterized protein n=1 Tax=Ensete ventricosum TaxID=4639 RepID=A0A426Z5I5_ENSVE|nr:hypothetical protein B296_00029977 [Ensete ventricosum]
MPLFRSLGLRLRPLVAPGYPSFSTSAAAWRPRGPSRTAPGTTGAGTRSSPSMTAPSSISFRRCTIRPLPHLPFVYLPSFFNDAKTR